MLWYKKEIKKKKISASWNTNSTNNKTLQHCESVQRLQGYPQPMSRSTALSRLEECFQTINGGNKFTKID